MINTRIDFELPDETGRTHNLDDYKGGWLVLYFYPKDDTPGCTKEACSFRDSYTQLEKMGVKILGVSKDTQKSHQKFKEKYNINFPLLSDIGAKTIKEFGAWGEKKFMGKIFNGIIRKTFLIDQNGIIRKIYDKVDVINHASVIIRDLEQLKA